MNRIAARLATILTATVLSVASAHAAQVPQNQVRRNTQDVVGHWNGRMEPAKVSAEIDLDLQQTGSTWKAEMTFRAGPSGGRLPIEELRVDGGTVLVRTRMEGADVRLDLTLDDGLLLGSVRITEKGRLFAEGPAGLARAADTAGRVRVMRWMDARGGSIEAAQRAAVITHALELLSANYVFSDRAERAVTDVRARAKRGEYDSLTTPARLAELLGRHLAEATGDQHVQMKVSAERPADPRTRFVETTSELAQLRSDAESDEFGIGKPRVLEGNVGYLEFKRFVRAELAGDALAAAMQSLAGTDALIIDLRESHGGDPVMVVLAASWLFDGRPRHWNDIRRRSDGTDTQFWTAAWLPVPRYAAKPVYVLTAHRTFSAPESLAYELQHMRRATIVGEVTGGGAHSGSWFPVDDQFSIFIPLSRYVSAASGGDWEGTGVKPDVECAAPEALERAHALALKDLKRK